MLALALPVVHKALPHIVDMFCVFTSGPFAIMCTMPAQENLVLAPAFPVSTRRCLSLWTCLAFSLTDHLLLKHAQVPAQENLALPVLNKALPCQSRCPLCLMLQKTEQDMITRIGRPWPLNIVMMEEWLLGRFCSKSIVERLCSGMHTSRIHDASLPTLGAQY